MVIIIINKTVLLGTTQTQNTIYRFRKSNILHRFAPHIAYGERRETGIKRRPNVYRRLHVYRPALVYDVKRRPSPRMRIYEKVKPT